MHSITITIIIYSNTAGDVASSEMIRILEPFKVFTVPEANEGEREVLKFAKNKIPYYNPKPCYAYYEFTGRKCITSDKNMMALNKVIIVGSVCYSNDQRCTIMQYIGRRTVYWTRCL